MNSKVTFSMATSHKQQKHCYLQRFSAMIFPKTRSFLTIFGFWSLPKQRGGYPPTPFHILNFKIFTKSKTFQFLELKTRPEPHFLTVFTMFYARAWIFTPKNATSKIIKKSLKNLLLFWWCLGVLGVWCVGSIIEDELGWLLPKMADGWPKSTKWHPILNFSTSNKHNLIPN